VKDELLMQKLDNGIRDKMRPMAMKDSTLIGSLIESSKYLEIFIGNENLRNELETRLVSFKK